MLALSYCIILCTFIASKIEAGSVPNKSVHKDGSKGHLMSYFPEEIGRKSSHMPCSKKKNSISSRLNVK